MLEPARHEFIPDWFSKPADSLLGLMRRREVPLERVAEALDGGIETLRRLVRGTQAIDEALANSLSAVVGGSPTFWLKRQANYERALDHALERSLGELDDWLERVPAPESRSRGRLSQAQKALELRNRLTFYGVNNLRAWHTRYGEVSHQAQFRTSQAFPSNAASVSLWLRQGELEAALTPTKRWHPETLQALLGNILKLSRIRRPDRFLPKLRALGAQAGVAVVVVRAPENCKASGASRLVASDKAMVLLSFRHLSDDHFWFTLLHECAHLLLHGANPFVDTDDTYLDHLEREANEFASACIIPPARWKDFADLRYDRYSVMRFAVSLGIAPGLIVGQLQHRGAIPRNRLNFLKRHWTWADVEAALG
jgi:HTH-type transcriptional regulator / antitoxin HigA